MHRINLTINISFHNYTASINLLLYELSAMILKCNGHFNKISIVHINELCI